MSGESTPVPRPGRPWPWAYPLVALAAVVVHVGDYSAPLIYDRHLIFAGQLWRLWTGHLVHFGRSHIFWDLCVFVPAGIWLERLHPRIARWFLAASPVFISALLLLCDPTLERYGGLSGVATGVLVLLACCRLRGGPNEPPWFWIAVLVLVAVKIGLELFSGTTLLVSGFTTVRNVPLAHVGGALAAVLLWLVSARGDRRVIPDL